MNSGGAKQLGMPITTVPGMESDFYSLIMAFSDIEVVLDKQDSPKYQATFPVYLKVESKKCYSLTMMCVFGIRLITPDWTEGG